MGWREYVKRIMPAVVLNNILLAFPFLYRTTWINYESHLGRTCIKNDLLASLELVLDLEGNVAECGSSRCGTSIIMANYLRATSINKIVYAFDSFEGFDHVELAKEVQADLAQASERTFTSTSYEYVKRKIKALGYEDEVRPIKGYFQDTLPGIQSGFCFALIDCDLKESMVYCAETIWPKMPSGGRLLFDDYTSTVFKGAKLGIEFFINKHEDTISEHGLMHRLYYVCKK